MRAFIDFSSSLDQAQQALRAYFHEPLDILVAHTTEQVKPLLEKVDAYSKQGLWCVGYMRYEAAPAFDSAFKVHERQNPQSPLAYFGVFKTPSSVDLAQHLLHTNSTHQVKWSDIIAKPNFDSAMDLIHQAIAAGDFYQVNYTSNMHGEMSGDSASLFKAMQQAQPNAYAAFIQNEYEEVLSVSPELFFELQQGHILVRPMKGTAARGIDTADDEIKKSQLRQSAKEQAENVMIVDLIRNDVSRIAKTHTVKVNQLFNIQTLPTLFQMVSDVEADLQDHVGLSDVMQALFPCGSITGAPKVMAMKMIKQIEPEERGVYCGTVGVVRPGGDATFNVAIRTVTLQKTTNPMQQKALCGIGSGITFDASIAGEWQEWRHKKAFLERSSQNFSLLETMRFYKGQLHQVQHHLDRMALAAQHFGFVFNRFEIEQQLQEQSLTWGQGAQRIRLLLEKNGQIKLEHFDLSASPEVAQVQWAATAFEMADSEFVRFKTTHRAHYDFYSPTNPAIFDTLLYNHQGEITEFTRGNIALFLDGVWYTPPLSCGLLNGIERQVLLDKGLLKERKLYRKDLEQAQGMAFMNSLRGWLMAQLVG